MPPGVKPNWDDNGVQTQANIIEFYRISTHDQDERDAQLVGARMPKV